MGNLSIELLEEGAEWHINDRLWIIVDEYLYMSIAGQRQPAPPDHLWTSLFKGDDPVPFPCG